MSWHNRIKDAVFLLFSCKNWSDCKTVPRYDCNKTRQTLLKHCYMTFWHSLNCWKALSSRILHMSHSLVLHYRQHPSHTLEYFGWTLLWKDPEVKFWLTEMTSADQSEEWGPCRLSAAVRASRVPLVTRGKAYISWASAVATQHQTIICDPTMFHNNNPNGLEVEEMKVSGNFFLFIFWDIKNDSAVQK